LKKESNRETLTKLFVTSGKMTQTQLDNKIASLIDEQELVRVSRGVYKLRGTASSGK
jgi:hypothetical protein